MTGASGTQWPASEIGATWVCCGMHNAGWSTQLIDHSPNLDIRSGGTGLLLLVGTAHAFEHRLALLIDKACEELLRVPKQQRPGKDLRGRIKCAEPGNELATYEQ